MLFFFFSHLTRRLTQYCSREYCALLLNPNSRYPPGPAVRPCDNAVIKILFKSPNTRSYARQVARVRQRGVRPRSSSTSRRHSSRTAQDSPRVRGTAGARVCGFPLNIKGKTPTRYCCGVIVHRHAVGTTIRNEQKALDACLSRFYRKSIILYAFFLTPRDRITD